MTNIVKNKNGIEFDIDAIATDLNGKMDRDCSNRSDAGSGVMAHMAMLSNKYIDYTLNSSGSTYTAPADGYFIIAKRAGAADRYVVLNNQTNGIVNERHGVSAADAICLRQMVRKGDIVAVYYDATGDLIQFRFYYIVGSEHEAT